MASKVRIMTWYTCYYEACSCLHCSMNILPHHCLSHGELLRNTRTPRRTSCFCIQQKSGFILLDELQITPTPSPGASPDHRLISESVNYPLKSRVPSCSIKGSRRVSFGSSTLIGRNRDEQEYLPLNPQTEQRSCQSRRRRRQ